VDSARPGLSTGKKSKPADLMPNNCLTSNAVGPHPCADISW
jgi:hypothetical protein